MLNEDELRESILLVFANKQDLPNAMSAAEMTDKLGIIRYLMTYIYNNLDIYVYMYILTYNLLIILSKSTLYT